MLNPALSSPFIRLPLICSALLKPGSESQINYAIEIKTKSIWKSFLSFFNGMYHSDDRQSFQNLKSAIGRERFNRIMQRKELALPKEKIQSNRAPLSENTLKKILTGLGDIRLEDLEEAAQIQDKQLKDLTTEEIDKLYCSLVPFNALQPFLLKSSQIPYYDTINTSGKGFKGMRERVETILSLWREVVEEHKQDLAHQLKENEILTSRLADREPPQGTLIRLHNGYFVVDRIFAGGGAYVSVLRELTGRENPLILCRGTAVRLNATSGLLSVLNDLQIEMGVLGVQTIWQNLSDYLREHQIQQVNVLGKSLGGAHAQYLTTLITSKTQTVVHELVTYYSVGVPDTVHTLFSQAIKETGKKQPSIFIVRNGGKDEKGELDYIPTLGGVHLHTPSDKTHIYYLMPDQLVNQSNFSRQVLAGTRHSFIKLIFKLIFSFPKPHIRQTTLKKYVYYKSSQVDLEVGKGLEMEGLRKWLARFFHKITTGYLNRCSFNDFYHSLPSQIRE